MRINSFRGMTFAPGKNQDLSTNGWNWKRNVDLDLEHLKKTYNCTVLVSLMEEFEYKLYKNESLFEKVTILLFIELTFSFKVKDHNIELVWYPIPDNNIPPKNKLKEFKKLIEKINNELQKGSTVVVHCKPR